MKEEWIFLKYDITPNRLICTRCNSFQEIPNKTQIDVMLSMLKTWGKIHRKCKKPKKGK